MKNRKLLFAASLTALVALASPLVSQAQSTFDDTQQLIAQIQTDKRAIVLKAMALDDAQVAAFTPIYDDYQAQRKVLMQRGVDLVDTYAANYGTMTDDAAKKLLKDWFALVDDENDLVKATSKKMGKVLPATQGTALRPDREQAEHRDAAAGGPRDPARRVIRRGGNDDHADIDLPAPGSCGGARRRCPARGGLRQRAGHSADYDRAADFGKYRTYGFVAQAGTDTAEFRSLAMQTLQAAAAREMESRGYTVPTIPTS